MRPRALTLLSLAGVTLLPACRAPVLRAGRTLRGYEICTPLAEGLAVIRAAASRRYGYVDRDGNIVIQARLADAQPFAEGLAAVQVGQWGKYGYIDRTGRLVVEPAFDAAFPFSESRAAVRAGGQYGFIDRSGRVTIAPRFERAFGFSGGRAKIVERGLAGFIDATGRTVVAPAYYKAGSYRDGLAPACGRTGCGFLDAAGNRAIAFDYEDVGDFASGFAPARSGGKWGYLDTRGRWLVAPAFDEAHEFQDDVALVGKVMDSQPDRGYGGYSGTAMVYGYLDRRGKFLIEPSIHRARPFSEGLARIEVPIGGLCSDCYETAYLRKDGSVLARYRFGGDFRGGVAVVKDGVGGEVGYLVDASGRALIEFDQASFDDPLRAAARPTSVRYGYVGRNGSVRLPHEFSAAESFSEGVALVHFRGRRPRYRSAFIDDTGAVRLEVPAGTSRAESFSGGFALLWYYQKGTGGHRFAYMDHAGAIRIEAPYREARCFSDGLAAVKISSRAGEGDWGYIDATGALAIAPAFAYAGPFVKGLAQVAFLKERYIYSGLIDRGGKILLELQYVPESGNHVELLGKYGRPSVSRELIPARDRDGFGYVNRAGSFVIRDSRIAAGDAFSEGLAPIALSDGTDLRWGYIDTAGKVVIEARFREAQLFSEGLAVVRDAAGRLGYLRRDGSWALPPTYLEEAHPFSEGLALVKLNGAYGYVDREGDFAIAPAYVRAASFSQGLAATAVDR